MTQMQIRRDDYAQARLIESSQEEADLAPDEIRVKIDSFGFSANNITYAVAGDQLGYWQFFPPVGDDAEGWGVLPVWGFGDVTSSNVEGIPVGDRLFGYFPPATTLTLKPTEVADGHFVDGAAHRQQLPSGYNLYRRVNAEPGYSRDNDRERMLLFPLHVTSFCLWDAIKDKGWYGAERIVVLSASSKTSIGLALALHDDPDAPPVVGVTSDRNMDFVEALGLYDVICGYSNIADLDPAVPTTIVDMSGNAEVLGQLHKHLDDNMKQTIKVGLTHWESARTDQNIIADRSEFFFAPDHIKNRIKEWGSAEFERRSVGFLMKAAAQSKNWLQLQQVDGLDELAALHPDVCAGKLAPEQGLIVKL